MDKIEVQKRVLHYEKSIVDDMQKIVDANEKVVKELKDVKD